MSSSLFAYKVVRNPEVSIPDGLKFTLRKRYGEPVDMILTDSDIPYLTGLSDGGIKGLSEVLKLLAEGQEIHIKEEY